MVNFLEKRIIAIDDEELNRVIFEGFFSVYNFTNFRIYRTAEEFLRGEPKLGDVDLLITDYFLPGMNGLNLLNFLKTDFGLSFPMFIFSAVDHHMLDIPREMILKKPIHLEEVFERIKNSFNEGEEFSFA